MKHLFAIVLALAPVAAIAHAGHGEVAADQPAHYLTSPEHILPIVLTAVVVVAYVLFRKKQHRHA